MASSEKFDLASIFRAYDIRGVFGEQLTEEVATALGVAFGEFLGKNKAVVVGRDVRLSGERLRNALISGLVSRCDVTDVGVVPTPLLYFATNRLAKDAGIMITASHNPPEWNGFKLFKQRGCIYGEEMAQIRKIAERVNLEGFERKAGRIISHEGILQEYEDFVLHKVRVEERLRLVADTANGACGLLVPTLFKRLGCSILTLNEKPDGRFPSHLPEPKEETLGELMKRVVEEEADFGVGYDGDGDRAVFVDDAGRMIPGDVVLLIFAKDALERRSGGTVVYELSCSMAVEEFVKALGGVPVVERVGHVFIMDRMIAEGAVLGGETSGHFYFPEVHGMDDAVFASLRMAEILSKTGKRLSEIVDSLPKYPSVHERNFSCPDRLKFGVVDRLTARFRDAGLDVLDIDGVKVLDEDGWVLLRASNTEPLIRVSAEARSEEKLKELYDFAVRALEQVIKESG